MKDNILLVLKFTLIFTLTFGGGFLFLAWLGGRNVQASEAPVKEVVVEVETDDGEDILSQQIDALETPYEGIYREYHKNNSPLARYMPYFVNSFRQRGFTEQEIKKFAAIQALESGWGTSGFCVEVNQCFGYDRFNPEAHSDTVHGGIDNMADMLSQTWYKTADPSQFVGTWVQGSHCEAEELETCDWYSNVNNIIRSFE